MTQDGKFLRTRQSGSRQDLRGNCEKASLSVEPQEKPMAVITGGQPGSGKGGITAQAQKEMAKQGGYVLVDPDLLRPEHPKHRALMRANDREAADFTHSDASKWAKQLTTDAI
ncbi:MAG TPA: zeta toxin family protein, partial [Pseudoduganella sp.]